MAHSQKIADLFQHFQKVLSNNTRLMERIADLERALGGDYIFDRAFIDQAATDLIRLVREVIYHTNALTANRYTALYDRLEIIAASMVSITQGAPAAEERRLIIPSRDLHRELDLVVGAKAATLGEIANHLHLPTPAGFALTSTAYHLFLTDNDLWPAIEAIHAESLSPRERAQRLRPLILTAPLWPAALRQAVRQGLDGLRHQLKGKAVRLAVRSSAVGEDGLRSFAGQFGSELEVEPTEGAVLTAWRQVVAGRFSEAVLDYGAAAGPRELPMAVLVQEMVPAELSGVIHSQARWRGEPRLLVAAVSGLGHSLADGIHAGHRFLLERQPPFGLVESELGPEPTVGLHEANLIGDQGLRRGSMPLSPDLLRRLAEYAVVLEKALDGPQEIEWALVQDHITLLQSRPLIQMRLPPPPPAEVAADLAAATVLLSGRGHAAQIGIASGPVVEVTPDFDPDRFPVGAVAVARAASPQLSPIARKAAALITNVGGPTGHLAAICREYRTPALFGTQEATHCLHTGMEVTVDVEERTVYQGLVPGLLRLAAARQDPHALSAEAATLRRLLRQVAPLALTDPGADTFRPTHCRTLHDIIRFCHEKAADSLIHLQLKGPLELSTTAPLLAVSIPLRLRLLDLDGGLAATANGPTVTADQVQSLPFRFLLSGLLSEAAWEREPAPFSMRDLMSSLTRPLSSLLVDEPYSGDNLAIIAARYCNLSLRLGYHFNVVDAYLAERPEESNVYFRFAGGFATEDKRRRRLTLIAAVLRGLHFRVESHGDLLTAKANLLAEGEMEHILTRIGELISFTRQLDVRLIDEQAVEEAFSRFLALATRAPGPQP